MQVMKFFKRSWEGLALSLMTAWDSSLHFADVFNFYQSYPLYPYFPLFNILDYQWFWAVYWGIAFLLAIKILIKINNGHKN
jgi:hypothetical protein